MGELSIKQRLKYSTPYELSLNEDTLKKVDSVMNLGFVAAGYVSKSDAGKDVAKSFYTYIREKQQKMQSWF